MESGGKKKKKKKKKHRRKPPFIDLLGSEEVDSMPSFQLKFSMIPGSSSSSTSLFVSTVVSVCLL